MRLTALLIFLWAIAGLLGSPGVPAVNMAPPDGVALPAPKLNIPGLPILLLAAAALKLNPPGAGAMNQSKRKTLLF